MSPDPWDSFSDSPADATCNTHLYRRAPLNSPNQVAIERVDVVLWWPAEVALALIVGTIACFA